MQGIVYALAFLAAFTASLVGTGAVMTFLRAREILDHPNERSSHKAPIPRGAGLATSAVLIVATGAIAAITAHEPQKMMAVPLAALVLAAVSWIDDLRGLNPVLRLAIQFAAAVVAVPAIAHSGLVFQGLLPPLYDQAAAVVLWVWFVNLFNFMDGIDGIAATEAASVGIGIFALALVFPAAVSEPGTPLYAVTVAAAALGFLGWNWEPAKIFLGDVGSVPLGYLLGFLLLSLAAQGQWAAALILPLYYMADSGITLAARLAAGEKIWEPHARHFYQQAARRFGSHAKVVRAIAAANLALIVLALLSVNLPWPRVIAAAAVVAILLSYFHGNGAQAER